jgi:hypothetical protein
MAATFPEHYRYVMAHLIAEGESLLITFAFTIAFSVRLTMLLGGDQVLAFAPTL